MNDANLLFIIDILMESKTKQIDEANASSLSRLVEKQLEELEALTGKIDLWTKYRNDYKDLKQVVDKLQDKVQFPHRIPIAGSRLAFVDGHIIHTNEFHVLLGDNYFALRSARQATKIIDRRLDNVDKNLKETQEAKRKTENWLRATEDHQREKKEFVEIIETM